MQRPNREQRKNFRNCFKLNVTRTNGKQDKMKRGLTKRLHCSSAVGSHRTSRDTSEKIKKNKQRNESQHTYSKRRYSTGSTIGEETDDSDFNPRSVRFRPARKKKLGYDIKHHKRQCKKKTLASKERKKLLLGSQLGYDIKHHRQEDKEKTVGCKETAKLEDTDFHISPLAEYATDSQSIFPTPSPSVLSPDGSDFITPVAASAVGQSSTSFPELKFKEFTPVITPDFDDETYRFQCSCPGLYQCTVTGLVFHMEGEGDVVYRTVPWNRRLLSQHHKKPAGPLFDIKCLQQCVCQLHLPHCEILSTGGSQFMSVAHVTDEGIEFIRPQKITETHVVINITGFSGYGNVKDEDSPPDLIRALVLLFYRPPTGRHSESCLSVLLVPRNIVVRDVQRTRRKLIGNEIYIDKPPHCKLRPNHLYTLSTRPQTRSVKIEPPEAEFDEETHSSYFTNFQVILKRTVKKINLSLKHKSSSLDVWDAQVCLLCTEERQLCGQHSLNLPPNDRLLDVRSSFIDGISEPVLKSLLDKLLEKTVITDSEKESVDEMENKRDKARFVIDTVRKKGEAASSEMIKFLCEVDPFLCDHLGLM